MHIIIIARQAIKIEIAVLIAWRAAMMMCIIIIIITHFYFFFKLPKNKFMIGI